jgi:flagellar motor switch protein FliG
MKVTGIEKAAMFIMSLSPEIVSKLFALMEEEEIKEISQTMSSLGKVPADTIERLIIEFSSEVNETLSFTGNIHNTEKLLKKILAKDKVSGILEEIRGPAGRNIWDKLGNVNEEVLANYLKNEYPQTVALVLSRLSPAQSAKVLTLFTQEFSFEVMKRMLAMDSIKKEALEKVERTLRTEFISNLSKTQKYDNTQIMAEIFNNFDRANESKFMDMLTEFNAESATQIKNLMFTFGDLAKINADGIQTLLKVIDKSRLALALKGAAENIRELFVTSMSQRSAKLLLEEIENMGPVRLKDVDEAQSEIITIAKDLLAKNEIEIMDGDESNQIIY